MSITFINFNGADSDLLNITASTTQVGVDTFLTIRNDSLTSSSISEIFFSGLDNAPTVSSTVGIVDFTMNNMLTLPGGVNINWNASTDYSFDAKTPSPFNGINPGEAITFKLDNINASDYNNDIMNGNKQIAFHLIDLNGSSGSFVNTVPEPTPASLIACVGLFLLFQRFLRK